MDFKTILEAGDLRGKRVLVRVDWNVPLEHGKVTEDYRIEKSLATIAHLQSVGAKVILISHLESTETDSLRAVYDYAANLFPASLQGGNLLFCEDLVGEKALAAAADLRPGEALLLENLRRDPGEKENSRDFAVELAAFGDIYVNEAFSASHREHASIVGVPKLLPGFAGLQFTEEVKQLSKAFYPKHPFLFILGGAKFETKLPLVKKFQDIADDIFIGGANAKPASEMGFADNPKITLPRGDIAALDADKENLEMLKEKISRSAFVLWNGPLGRYEDGHTSGTIGLAKLLADSGKEVIVGGADTIAAIKEADLLDRFSFISTGGGAMLDFLAIGSLPGIDVLKRE